MKIIDIQEEIISDFELFDNWNDKYAYIIELGKKLAPMSEEDKTEERIIRGCQSRVWLKAGMEGGVVKFETESDAIIVKGLIYLLLKVYNNNSPEDIMNTEPFFMERIGMQQHLSPTRANGLAAMAKQIKMYAVAFDAQQKLTR
jgi:cysteine desulfuration protein SufE